MSVRSIVLIAVMALVALFVAVNWSVMTRPTDLSLIVTTVYAPVGVVMLCLMGLMFVVFFGFIAYQQSAVLAETRRHAKEMTAQRELADKAEASRFTELRALLTDEIQRVMVQLDADTQAVQARVDRLEIGLRETSPDGQLQQLAELSERHANDIQSRVDRLEIGLREMEQGRHAEPKAESIEPVAEIKTPGLDPSGIRYF